MALLQETHGFILQVHERGDFQSRLPNYWPGLRLKTRGRDVVFHLLFTLFAIYSIRYPYAFTADTRR